MSFAHRPKRARDLQCLLKNANAITAGDDDRRRKIQSVVQTLDRRHRVRLQDDPVRHALHTQHTNGRPHELGKHELLEAAVVSVHDVERHLNCIEREAVLLRDGKGVQVNARILMSGESDVPELPSLSCLEERRVRATLIKDPVRVLEPDHLVVLDEVDAIGLQAFEGLL